MKRRVKRRVKATKTRILSFSLYVLMLSFSIPASASAATTITVKAGDTLSAISNRYHTSVSQLESINHLKSSLIKVGQKLVVSTSTTAKTTASSSTNSTTTASASTYTVKSGDTLSGIAAKYHVTVTNLKQWNHLTSDLLLVGQHLSVSQPNQTSTTPAKTVSPAKTTTSTLTTAKTTTQTGTGSTTTTTVKGLDVSNYQSLTQTSFNTLKSEGYSFVILKATEGTTYTDPQFYTYYTYARNAGLSVDAYHMIENSTTTAAKHVAEAQHFYNVLSQTQAKTGYPFSGYAFEDVETTSSNGITTTWWKNYAPACVGNFLNELQTLGQTKVGIYAPYYYWTTYLDNNTKTWPSTTKIWLARYNTTLGTNADVWQYTSTGTIDGISGSVDLDISYDSDL